MSRRAPVEKPDSADARAFAAAQDLCRRHVRGFHYASAFLSRDKRNAALAVVAFCHMIREALAVPDEALEGAHGLRHHPLGAKTATTPTPSPAVAAAELSPGGSCTSCGPTASPDARVALFRERLAEIYDGRLELPRSESRSEPQHALHAFASTVRRYPVPRHYFLDLVDGLRKDQAVSRYATWASLERHCRSTAGPVGLVLCAVLGVTHSGAGEHALSLATAVRLTTILRDLKKDRARGRVYLPQEDLARFRYGERDLAAGVVNDRFRDLMRFQVARARELYRRGTDGICWLADDGSRLTVSALATTCAGVLDAVERQDYDVFTRPPSLTTAQKLRRLPMAWRLARPRPGGPVSDPFRAAR